MRQAPLRYSRLASGTVILALLASLPSCRLHPDCPVPDPGALESRVVVFDAATGDRLPLAELSRRLAAADAIFLGETHNDETTHEIEQAIYEALVAERGGAVTLALEMFSRDRQRLLDDYLAGRLPEHEFLAQAQPWANYATAYRPLVESARRAGLPVVASNAPRALAVRIARGRAAGFAELSSEERMLVAPELRPASADTWERFARAVRGHGGSVSGSLEEEHLYSVQSVWDNTMAHSCVEALDRNPEHLVLHLNGSFHSDFSGGLVQQLRSRRPKLDLQTVTIVPVPDLEELSKPADAARADYVVYAKERGYDLSENRYWVRVPAELCWSLHVPRGGEADRWPLLIWLAGEEGRARDVAEWWRLALGDEAAVAVVEPFHPVEAREGHLLGRWYLDESFFRDSERIVAGLGRLEEYVERWFPVDGSRVVIAGEGRGATLLVAWALYGERESSSAACLAFLPAREPRFDEIPFPDPIDEATAAPRTCIYASEGHTEWWLSAADDVSDLGRNLEVRAYPSEHSSLLAFAERSMRIQLGLESGEVATDGTPPVIVVAEREHPQPLWLDLCVRALANAGRHACIVSAEALAGALSEEDERGGASVLWACFDHEAPQARASSPGVIWSAADLADGVALPVARGAFAGVTVLVIQGALEESAKHDWVALEETNAIQVHSRFASLRVAFDGSSPSLADVLRDLEASGTSSVLVVPAVFAARLAEMAALHAIAAPWEDRLRIEWQPGLGAELYRIVARKLALPEPSR